MSRNYGDFGRVPPFHFREDGFLVDATGRPVEPLPKVKTRKHGSLDMAGPAKLRKKPNPLMVTSDFDTKDQDE